MNSETTETAATSKATARGVVQNMVLRAALASPGETRFSIRLPTSGNPGAIRALLEGAGRPPRNICAAVRRHPMMLPCLTATPAA